MLNDMYYLTLFYLEMGRYQKHVVWEAANAKLFQFWDFKKKYLCQYTPNE